MAVFHLIDASMFILIELFNSFAVMKALQHTECIVCFSWYYLKPKMSFLLKYLKKNLNVNLRTFLNENT